MDELVKIQMLTRGPNSNYRPKQVVEVDEARAKELIAKGHARLYPPPEEEVKDADD